MAAKRKKISRMHFKRGINFEKLFAGILNAWGAMGLEIGCMPFSPDAGIKVGEAKDGKSGSLTVPVTYGFMARLPFVERDKAEHWEELYKAEVEKAVAAHGSDYGEWQISPGGTCGILMTVSDDSDGQILVTTLCIVEDNEGKHVGSFHLFRDSDIPGAAVLEDLKADSLEELTRDAAAALASPALCIETSAWNILTYLFGLAIEDLETSSDWSFRELHRGVERAAWILTPTETDNASDELKKQMENIIGTLAHPVFPRKNAVFVMSCVCDKNVGTLEIDGPFSIEPYSLETECELYRLAANPGQKSLFKREIDCGKLIKECGDEKSLIFEEAKSLASDISDVMGMGIIRDYPDDYEYNDEEDFEENNGDEMKNTEE